MIKTKRDIQEALEIIEWQVGRGRTEEAEQHIRTLYRKVLESIAAGIGDAQELAAAALQAEFFQARPHWDPD